MVGELYLTDLRLVWLSLQKSPFFQKRELSRDSVNEVVLNDGGMACSGFRWGIDIETAGDTKLFRFYGKLDESKAAAEQWQEVISRWAGL